MCPHAHATLLLTLRSIPRMKIFYFFTVAVVAFNRIAVESLQPVNQQATLVSRLLC